MNNKKTKEDSDKVVLRVPKQKKRLGLFVPEINLPHLELVKPEAVPAVLQEEADATPSLPSQTTQTRQTRQTRQTSIAPERNYQKVPNSITKEAIPGGLFKGKAKQLYDVLYSLTRGAIVPTRAVRIRKGELMKKANIGSRITFDSNIAHLQLVGLIKETVHAGEHAGNEFEVLTVEEINTLASQTTQTSQSQKLVRLVSLETSQTSQSLNEANEDVTSNLKPFFKTLSFIDDETPLIAFIEKLNTAARAATGKDLTFKDLAALDEIAELLINETSIARAKTKTISIYLKFAAENLRRRLYSKTISGSQKQPHQVKNFSEPVNSYTPEPLGTERELILQNLKKIVDENGFEAVEIFRENYTEGDWEWITENLKH